MKSFLKELGWMALLVLWLWPLLYVVVAIFWYVITGNSIMPPPSDASRIILGIVWVIVPAFFMKGFQ